MPTVDEVGAVPLFSGLPAGELARTAAELHLSAGEFAVHEGGEAALFAVLAGRIEVVKTFDGIERTLGCRGRSSARCRSRWARVSDQYARHVRCPVRARRDLFAQIVASIGSASFGFARIAIRQPATIRHAPVSVVQVAASSKKSQPSATAQMKAEYSVGIRYCASARA